MSDWDNNIVYSFHHIKDHNLHAWLKSTIGYGKRLKGNAMPLGNLSPDAEWYFRELTYEKTKIYFPNGRTRGTEFRMYFF